MHESERLRGVHVVLLGTDAAVDASPVASPTRCGDESTIPAWIAHRLPDGAVEVSSFN